MISKVIATISSLIGITNLGIMGYQIFRGELVPPGVFMSYLICALVVRFLDLFEVTPKQ